MMVKIKREAYIGVCSNINGELQAKWFTNPISLREADWAELGESGVQYDDDPIFIEPEFAYVKYDSVNEVVPIANASNYEILSYGVKINENEYWFIPAFMVEII